MGLEAEHYCQEEFFWGDGGVADGDETDDEAETAENPEATVQEMEVEQAAVEVPTAETHEGEARDQSKRSRRRPGWMDNFVTGEEVSDDEEGFTIFALYISIDDSVHFLDDAREERWREAIKQEIQSIERNHTYKLCHHKQRR